MNSSHCASFAAFITSSTVSKLAARFYDADKGTIKLGGRDISTINPENLLSAYSIVFQDVTLFNNTIMENIRIYGYSPLLYY